MERLLNITAIMSAVLFLAVLISLRRAHMRVEHSVSWLTASALLLLLTQFENFWDNAARWMGLAYPPLAFVVIILSVFLVVFYRFSRAVSQLKDANVALTQRLAILEYRVRSEHEEEAPC